MEAFNQVETESVKNFLQAFYTGQIQAQSQAIENTEIYFSNSDIESLVSRYAHGDCYAWAITAMRAGNISNCAYLVNTDIGPVHAFVASQDEKLGFDANGVQSVAAIKADWGVLSRANGATRIWIEKLNLDQLEGWICLGDDDYQEALMDMKLLTNFIIENQSKL